MMSLDPFFDEWTAAWTFHTPPNDPVPGSSYHEVILELTYNGENMGVWFNNTAEPYHVFTMEFTPNPGTGVYVVGLDNGESYLKDIYQNICFAQAQPNNLFINSGTGTAISLSGDIEFMNNQIGACRVNNGFPNLLVQVQDPADPSKILAWDMTDNAGHYFCRYLKLGCEMRVQPNMNLGHDVDGVNTQDLIKIQQYLLGFINYTDVWEYIASDANLNGSVSTADILKIRKLVLGKITHFEKAWRYIEGFRYNAWSQSLPNPFTFEDYRQETFNTNRNDLHFKAIKVGDVTGDYDICGLNFTGDNEVQIRTGEDRYFSTSLTRKFPVSEVCSGVIPAYMICNESPGNSSEVECAVYLNYEGDGAGIMELNIPEGTSISGIDLPNPGEVDVLSYALNEEQTQVRFTWVDDISPNAPIALIHLSKDFNDTPVRWSQVEQVQYNYLSDGEMNYRIELQPYEMEQANGLQIGIAPNPFIDFPVLTVVSPREKTVEIHVSNATGQPLFTRSATLHAGPNLVSISALASAPKGLYFFSLTDGARTVLRKAIKL